MFGIEFGIELTETKLFETELFETEFGPEFKTALVSPEFTTTWIPSVIKAHPAATVSISSTLVCCGYLFDPQV